MYGEALRKFLSNNDAELEEKLKEIAPDTAALLRTDPGTLSSGGVRKRDAILPGLISDIMSRCALEEMKKNTFLKAGSAKEYLTFVFRTMRNPGCVWLPLDQKGRIIKPVILSEGKKFYIRELTDVVQEECLRYKSFRGIVAHNYEKTMPQNIIPYIADADYTFRALRTMGIELTDYILVSGVEAVSIFQRIGE